MSRARFQHSWLFQTMVRKMRLRSQHLGEIKLSSRSNPDCARMALPCQMGIPFEKPQGAEFRKDALVGALSVSSDRNSNLASNVKGGIFSFHITDKCKGYIGISSCRATGDTLEIKHQNIRNKTLSFHVFTPLPSATQQSYTLCQKIQCNCFLPFLAKTQRCLQLNLQGCGAPSVLYTNLRLAIISSVNV